MKILEENVRRQQLINAPFNPITGLGSVGERQEVVIPDFLDGTPLFLPVQMFNSSQLLQQVIKHHSITDFLRSKHMASEEGAREAVAEGLIRARIKYDFPFWAAAFARIKDKDSGLDIPFVLNRPQRTLLIPAFEQQRLANQPIRLCLVKARQLGGSTATQLYMGWQQMALSIGLNSLIVGHISAASIEVEDMFVRMTEAYPTKMLYEMGMPYSANEKKFVSVFGHPNIHRIPQRDCKIKIGTAMQPNSARGGDYKLVHCTEVGLWRETEKMTPEQIVASATSGVLYRPGTMIVYESTANGTDNFFANEYQAAKDGTAQSKPLFVAWYDIDFWSLPFATDRERADFAKWLWQHRAEDRPGNVRQESGNYLWRLWEKGASLEAINWYVHERAKYTDPAYMYSEFPSDDVEAFVYTGDRVFDTYYVEQLKPATTFAPQIGDVYADAPSGKKALQNLRFKPDANGSLWVWEPPEIDAEEKITNRYVVAVDIGGRSYKADWSVIVVFDRYWLMEGDKPSVVAQIRYHEDMDRLAWKAAQIAAWYDNALLVIESNTLETKDRDRYVDGDNSTFIINQLRDVYPNLYARRQKQEDVKLGKPIKYGFHTNVQTKPQIIDNLVAYVRDNLYVERDKRALDELRQYERKPNGTFGAISGCHDDLLMARAIALWVSSHEMPLPKRISRTTPILADTPIISEATI